jgi:hypothetical protein
MNGGTFVMVYDTQNSQANVVVEDESTIDAAVERWISSGQTQNTLLMLTLMSGATWKIRASDISNWVISSKAIRDLSRAHSAALSAEEPPDWQGAGAAV